MTKNRGNCPCGRGRGFRRWQTAREVRSHMTTLPEPRYAKCEHGRWHW